MAPETPGNETQALSNLLQENRRFAPPADLAAAANVTAAAYAEAGGRPARVLGECRPTG